MKKTNALQNEIVYFEFPISHTSHSKRRTSQRGIQDDHIQIGLNCSESYFKQGLIFHIVMDKLIPDNLEPSLKKKISNLVIVIASDSNSIITCYKSKNASRRIKCKRDNLSKYRLAS